MGKAQSDAVQRELTMLEKEYGKLDLWDSLHSQDKMEIFRVVIGEKIEAIKESYHSISKDDLTLAQAKHTLLKELLFNYDNAGKVKAKIIEQMNELRKKRDNG
jgi:hypothetical protein